MKLKEADSQRTIIAAVKDLDFWLGEVESLLTNDEVGKDNASSQNLMKEHKQVEADITAHEDRIKELSVLVDSGQFDSNEIRDKKENISNRYKHIQSLAANRKAQLLQAAYAIA